ncbi:MAG: hypothetical protein AAFP76_13225, partial [Bacteroidota bacterium]
MKKITLMFRALLLFVIALASHTVYAQNTPLGTPATQNPDGTTDVPGTPTACATGFSFYTIDHDDENTGAFLPAGIGVTTSLVNNGTTNITVTSTPSGAGIGDVDNIVVSGGRMNYSSTDGGNADATYNFDVTVTNPYIFIGDMETFTTINIFDCAGNPVNVNLMNGQSRFGAGGNSAFITGTTSTNQDGYIQVPGSFDCLVINIDNPAPFTLDVIQISVGVCAPDSSLLANIAIDASGNLVYTDADGLDDDITMIVEGSNYRISDSNENLIAGNGTTQDGIDVLVPIASVTGEIQINTQDGDDILTVDFDGGDFGNAITYNGGDQTAIPGDILVFNGTGSYASVNHTFVNENDGSVDITGNSTITYTGLEPIIDNLDAVDRIFTFTGGAETITLDAGGTLDNQIDSTLGESVDFNNPTASLTINAGTGNDIINIEGVGDSFDANLTVNGDDDDDDILFQTNSTDLGSGNLIASSEELGISADISTTGDITTSSADHSFIINNAVVQTTDGAITITGGAAPSSGTNYRGLDMNSGTVEATGTGSVTIVGTGFDSANGNGRNGVFIRGNSVVRTVSGDLSITGTGSTTGNQLNLGIRIDNPTLIESTDGDITLTGTGGTGTGNFNVGVALLFDGIVVQTLGTGAININGTGGTGAVGTYGTLIQSGRVLSAGGGITIDGNPGSTTANSSSGVAILVGSNIADSGSGNIVIRGTASTGGTNSNHGVVISNAPVNTITTASGNITMIGNGGSGTAGSHVGVLITSATEVLSTAGGLINLTGTGGAGTDSNTGIFVEGISTVQTNAGGITLNGTGGNSIGNSNQGVVVSGQASVQDLSTGSISITGQAGNGVNFNRAIDINNANTSVTSNGGNIILDGTGNVSTTGNFNLGTAIRNSSNVATTGTGTITIL